MSWKIYLIIITNSLNIQINDIPKKLGFENLKEKEEISIMEAQNKSEGISIAKIDDKILIVSSNLAFDILENKDQKIKNKLIQLFPGSEITTLVSAFGVNSFSVIQNGKEIRKKMVYDSPTKIDIGEKLNEEIECYNRIIKDESILETAKEIAATGEMTFDDLIDYNVTEETVFKLTKRYFKNAINQQNSDFDKVKMSYFK
ncbi:hypothetical protein [uncultured Chryseobacterium sp.]|uniref:hypothetical protein n=1 Tax=uncultured Chryseobacterium sp. TaxID=259322 RepID=UPI0025DE3322|nr:hypothetical protein [uncultured Chryseobacterium sp.]